MPVGALEITPETVERHRDLLMLKYRADGVSQTTIGAILGLDQATVSRRLRGIPPHVRERFRKQPLGRFD